MTFEVHCFRYLKPYSLEGLKVPALDICHVYVRIPDTYHTSSEYDLHHEMNDILVSWFFESSLYY